MGTLAWLIPVAAVWAFGVRFFWRAGAWLPYFILGSAGAAFLLVIAMREVLPGEDLLRAATAMVVDQTAWLMGVQTAVTDPASGDLLVIGVPYRNEWTLLTIGIECSGLLELATLCGLVLFFPALPPAKRVRVLGIALVLTFLANVVRMLVIVLALAYGGQGTLDVAHVVLGRFVFFVLAIGIYWFAITRPTLDAVSARLREAR